MKAHQWTHSSCGGLLAFVEDRSSQRNTNTQQHRGISVPVDPPRDLPSMVWWGSWCCESGRCQSENGYFTTPGPHHTTGGILAPEPAKAPTGEAATPPPQRTISSRTQARGFPGLGWLLHRPCRHWLPEAAVYPQHKCSTFKEKATPGNISFLQRKWCYQASHCENEVMGHQEGSAPLN
ncbi:uncharacterized protein LOC118147825 [Callithrix jacchus]